MAKSKDPPKRGQPKKRAKSRISAAQRKIFQQSHQRAQNTARNAARALRDFGLYKPKSVKKMTKGRRSYIGKLVKRFAEYLDQTKYIPTKITKEKPATRRKIKAQAGDIGLKATGRVVFVPKRDAAGTVWDKAKIAFDKDLKKFKAVRTRKVKKPGKGKPGTQTSEMPFADYETMTRQRDALLKRFNELKSRGKHIRFIVYGRGLSRNVYTDYDDMIGDFDDRYKSFHDAPTDFVRNIELIIVDKDEPRRNIYRRLFDPETGIYRHYRGR